MRYLASLLVVALTLTVPAGPPAVDGQLASTLLISGGTLIDGTGREPVRDAVIVIQGSKIVTVPMAGAEPAPPDAQRIDAHGKWIIPGLIDMHVHYYEWMGQPFLRHGVTTVRDVDNNLDRILDLRRESRSGEVKRPRIFACGPLIDGPSPRHGPSISVSVTTEEDARDVARRLPARGVDCLKVFEQLTPRLVAVIAQEAQRAGVPLTAHLRETTAVDALKAGVNGLEHAFGFEACDERAGAEVSRLVVERNAYVLPTLAIMNQAACSGS